MVIKRETMKFFIENDYRYIFGNKFTTPDEHYFINIFIKFNISFINKRITFTEWKQSDTSHPVTFDTITEDMLEKIRNTGCLFMRKISRTCVLPSFYAKYRMNLNSMNMIR